MPELPEAETIRSQLERFVRGKRIAAVALTTDRLRTPLKEEAFARHVVGRRIEAFTRRGKFLVMELSDDGAVMIHLGMTGTFRIVPPGTQVGPHERVLFALDDGEEMRFVDPRKFGMIVPADRSSDAWPPPSIRAMGPEPLGDRFDTTYLYGKTRNRRIPIKPLLMDQHVVAGIGNIYASEILFRAGVRPGRAAGRLTRAMSARIVEQTKAVLAAAIAAGGTTIDNHTNVDGSMGMFVQQLAVYGRKGEPCPTCRTPVVRTVQANRSTYYCPSCQK